jgi:chemotaxis regulatin CheY-phosphate phosphatase CheZ
MTDTQLTKEQEKELVEEVKDCIDESGDGSKKEVEQKIHSYYREKLNQTISAAKAKELASHLVNQVSKFRAQFRERSVTAIIAAFSFIIAFSWQDLIVSVIKTYTKTSVLLQYPYIAQLFTALIVTVVAVLGIMIVSRWASKP